MSIRRSFFMLSVAICVVVSTALGSSVLVEAESFTVKGGWVVDQQFMDTMGSPYLLAHGLGAPVDDAVTTVTFPSTGTYKVWVRTKNWAAGPWEAPGQFMVVIDNSPLAETFGTETGWGWQDGGSVTISKKQVEIRLIDLTGFEGRCDAIYFDTDKSASPLDFDAKKPDINRQWRNALRGLPATPSDGGKFDVVIVGGGIAGCGAALAAEKEGLSVALIQDRMALGGNASSEIRVHTLGIYGQGQGILEKIDTRHYPNGSAKSIQDEQKRENAMAAATGITMFRPWRGYGVQMKGSMIVSVDACSTISGEALRIRSDIFIDCTGDGWIGFWAGAEYRYGRESKSEFNEGWSKYGDLWSPEVPDNRVMGSSVLWKSSKTSTKSTFPEVPWAMDVAKSKSALAGEWYWEHSDNNKHMIDDAEEIRDHMFRAIYGSFYNAKKNGKNPYHKLSWMGYLNGKRESRRLIGDYIYKQSDMMDGTLFDDAVVEEIRDIDVHYQKVLTGSPYDFLAKALFRRVPRYYIPFRCLYSKNIDNLMMAGRCFSCTHVGLGGPRVMRTCGQMGIATGYAASLCKKYGTNPRGVYTNYIIQLKDLVSNKPAVSSDISAVPTIAVDWGCWRGGDSNGSMSSGDYPVRWDPEEVLWKVAVPGKGFSTPVVWDKKIYLTTGAGGLDTVIAFDWSGKQIWQRELGKEIAGKHKNASGSNPSAVTDGSGIFVFFKSGNFAALELDGSVRWKTNLFERYGKDDRYWDFGSSPVLTKKNVVIAEMHDGESWVAGFDKVSGELRWKVSRNYETAREGSQSYSTPIVFSHKGREALLIWGGHHLTAHDAADGKVIWSCGDFNPEGERFWPSIASPVISGTVAVVPCGRDDRRQPRLHGIRMGGSGDVTKTHRLWSRNDTGSFVPTPAEYKGRVYIVRDTGGIDCIDPLTGKNYWSGVFPKGKGNFYSSPLIAGGHLYAAREDGTVFVIGLKDKFEIISKIEMKEKIIASPIAISGRLLIRTSHHLFCIGKK